MPNDTLRANAQAISIDRRAALASLAAAGALLVAPRAAKACEPHPDAELIALAQRLKAMAQESEEADIATDELCEQFVPPPVPKTLIVQEGDDFYGDTRMSIRPTIGKPFSEEQMKVIRSLRCALQRRLSSLEPDLRLCTASTDLLGRVTEVDLAARQYLADIEAAKEAAGITAAQAKATDISDRLRAGWRDLAIMPARTLDGVFAKMDAVTRYYYRQDPDSYPNLLAADDVINTEVSDLGELRASAEA